MDFAGNPYTPRATTDNPVGRDSVIRKIEQAVIAPVLATHKAAPGGVILYGVRGIGKTSILRSVQVRATNMGLVTVWAAAAKRASLLSALPDVIKASLITNEVIKPQEWSLEELGFDLNLGIVRANSKVKGKQTAKWDVPNVELLLRHAAKLCLKKKKGLILFIDEIHAVKQEELAVLLNALQNITDDRVHSPAFGFLAAGLPSVQGIATMAATFGERTLFEEVSKLSDRSVRTAIVEPARERGVTYSSEALELLVKKSNGYPFFVQLFAYNAWSHAKGNDITLRNVEDSLIDSNSDISNLFNARFAAATPTERAFIIALARLGRDGAVRRADIAKAMGKPSDGISMLRRQLISKAIITEEEYGSVKFTLPGFADYVLRETE